MSALIRTTCSGCGRTTRVDLDNGTATVEVESNGRRGSGHVPAHTLETSLTLSVFDGHGDAGLAMWDCPVCEYADSIDLGEVP